MALGPRSEPVDAKYYAENKRYKNHKTYEQIHNAERVFILRTRKPKDGRDLLLPPRYGEHKHAH